MNLDETFQLNTQKNGFWRSMHETFQSLRWTQRQQNLMSGSKKWPPELLSYKDIPFSSLLDLHMFSPAMKHRPKTTRNRYFLLDPRSEGITLALARGRWTPITLRNKKRGHWEVPSSIMDTWLVVEPTHLKNMLVKMGIFPKDRGENKKYLKRPPRYTYLFSDPPK